jgi:hypothetical protein
MSMLAPEALVSRINCRIDWLWDVRMDRHPSTQKDGHDATPNDTEQTSAVVVVLA